MKVAYLGPEGTFSEEAAMRFFQGQAVEWVVCPAIPDVLEAILNEDVLFGIVPIENSIDGSVNVALDGLLRHDELFVCGELVLPIQQMLLGLPGTHIDQVAEVWSIPPPSRSATISSGNAACLRVTSPVPQPPPRRL